MAGKTFPRIFLLALLLVGLSPACKREEDLLNLIPQDALVVLYLKSPEDGKVPSLLGLIKEMVRGREGEGKKEVIEEIYAETDIREIAGAFFVQPSSQNPEVLLAVRLTKRVESRENLLNALDTFLERSEGLDRFRYANRTIVRRPESFWEDSSDLAVYTYSGRKLLLASNFNVLKEVIKIFRGEGNSLKKSSEFQAMRREFLEPRDGFLYIDNRGAKFTEILRRWEKKWPVRLFASGKNLSALGVSFAMVDAGKLKARIIFASAGEELLPQIEEEARFFEEVIKRKLIAEKLIWTSKIEPLGRKYVALDFEVAGLKWR